MSLISAIADYNGDLSVIKKILEDRPDLNVIQKRNKGEYIDIKIVAQTPLTLACKLGYKEIVQLLFLHEPNLDPNFINGFKYTPLIVACMEQQVQIVEFLVQIPVVKINSFTDQQQRTPFMLACVYNNIEIYEILWANQKPDDSIDLLQKDYRGYTAFEEACASKAEKIVEIFFNKHLSSEETTFMPLAKALFLGLKAAILNKAHNIADLLQNKLQTIKPDVRADFKKQELGELFAMALQFNHLKLASMLLLEFPQFPKDEIIGNSNKTAFKLLLDQYIIEPSPNIRRILMDMPNAIEFLANQYRTNNQSIVILKLLISVINEQISNLLLLVGADVSQTYEPYLRIQLLEAYELNDIKALNVWYKFQGNKIANSPEFKEKIYQRFTSSMAIKRYDFSKSIKYLINIPNDLIEKTLSKFTTKFLNQLLSAAIREEFTPLIKILLVGKRIDVNQPDADGKTLLWRACEINAIEVVEILLSCPRVNKTSADNNGESPAKLAERLCHLEILSLLKADNPLNQPLPISIPK